jgi:protein-tyrosine phosphatase
MSRHLHFPELHNARDLGGLPTQSGAVTRWRAFVRTDGLHNLNDEGRAALHDYGVRTVIDLRMPEELSNLPNPLQGDPRVNFVHVSLLGLPGDESWKLNKTIVGPHREWALMMLEHSKPRFADVFKAIAGAPEGTVLFHCHAGKDRTGLIADLLLDLAGVPEPEIVDDYDLSNERLRPLHTRLIEKITDPAERDRVLDGWSVYRPTAHAVLDHVRANYGGARGYLAHVGVSETEIAAVHRRLMDV